MKNRLVTNTQVEYFLYDISKKISDYFYAGVICDKDGFVISSRITKNNHKNIDENELALRAIIDKKKRKNRCRFFVSFEFCEVRCDWKLLAISVWLLALDCRIHKIKKKATSPS